MTPKENSAFIFQGGLILLYQNRIPDISEISELYLMEQGTLDFLGPKGAIWGRISREDDLPEGFTRIERRELRKMGGVELFKVAGSAWGLSDWYTQSRFCGCCGTAMVPAHGEAHAMLCPKCKHMLFPIMCPAIIVAIERNGKLLLAHNAMSPSVPKKRFSVLAGFVEVGESFEDAVHREIMEEVGIEVQDLRYFDSQFWPFPRSMMVAFTAKWKSGEIQVDGKELTEADWYSVDEIPEEIPGTVSIAGRLIEDFKWRFRKRRSSERHFEKR